METFCGSIASSWIGSISSLQIFPYIMEQCSQIFLVTMWLIKYSREKSIFVITLLQLYFNYIITYVRVVSSSK
jgi:hypothetical protein